jgi:uncharacterized protein YdaU (DUF1376 family)
MKKATETDITKLGRVLFFRFFHDDWRRDTRPLSFAAKGAWIEWMAYAWSIPSSSTESKIADLARILGSNLREMQKVIAEWEQHRICDIERLHGNVIRITCRRMERDIPIVQGEMLTASERGKAGAIARWSKQHESHASSIPQGNAASSASSNACEDAQAMRSSASSASSVTASAVTAESSTPPPAVAGGMYPTQEQVLSYAKGAPVIITPEQATSWWEKRSDGGWQTTVQGVLTPIANWRGNLHAFVRSWNAKEKEKQAKAEERQRKQDEKDAAKQEKKSVHRGPAEPRPTPVPRPARQHPEEEPFEIHRLVEHDAKLREMDLEWEATPHPADELPPSQRPENQLYK